MLMAAGSRPASLASRSRVARFSRSSTGVTRFGSHPSPQATTRSSTRGASPPRSTGGGGFLGRVGVERAGGGARKIPLGPPPPPLPPPPPAPDRAPGLPPRGVGR